MCLTEVLLMSIHNIRFHEEIINIDISDFLSNSLSGAVHLVRLVGCVMCFEPQQRD